MADLSTTYRDSYGRSAAVAGRLPPVRNGASAKTRGAAAAAAAGDSTDKSSSPHAFHQCGCYGHEKTLPDYKQLQMPRTNNYYAATGGCPCIPRAAAHPGSWRLREAQMRSSTHRCGSGCIKKHPEATHKCCQHSGFQYGWHAGPHTVKGKNTAAAGKCDTFGNLAFKSTSGAYMPAEDNVSDVSSVSPGKLEDLEALILEEHQSRIRAECDLDELRAIHDDGGQDAIKRAKVLEDRRRAAARASEGEMNELLREVRDIVGRPLNQTNMGVLRRILDRQEILQRNRDHRASKIVAEEDEE